MARRNGTKSGKAIGHPRVSAKLEATIRASLQSGDGIHKTAKACGVGVGTVQRVRREMLGVFAEFEREMIRERVCAGLARARQCGTESGTPIGHAPLP